MMIIINFKNYVHGEKALRLAKKIEKYLPRAIVAVSAVDIGYLKYHTKLTIYAQHVDSTRSPTRSTGFITPEAINACGAKGSLLNHSEHQLILDVIRQALSDLNELNLKAVVCAPTLKVAKELIKLKPYAIAFENLNLIATNKSITQYRANDVKKFAEILSKTKILHVCGAGIHSKEDAIEAKKLGCKGVLIASAIANSKNPEKLLKELSKI
ncbi:triose-phosphate isomerase [Candidatus Pacearchaeota archaeon]|nr:triose-phosphate isomerase [Candidatus Pacearchaeota archaeon]